MLIAAIIGLCMKSKKAPLVLSITSAISIAAVAHVSTYRDFEAEQVLLHLWQVSAAGDVSYIIGVALFWSQVARPVCAYRKQGDDVRGRQEAAQAANLLSGASAHISLARSVLCDRRGPPGAKTMDQRETLAGTTVSAWSARLSDQDKDRLILWAFSISGAINLTWIGLLAWLVWSLIA
ncbi:hypothetical protein CLBKND_01059 [Methylorubrum aminovorans]